jgi:hypothetical protein
MVLVFWFVKCNKGNIFVFSKLIMTENKNSDKVNGKLFLIIKSGPGFMGSLMHSLIKDMTDIVSALWDLGVQAPVARPAP